MTLKSDSKFEKKLTLGSNNNMRNFVNFNAGSSKSENLHFDVKRLSKVYYVWSKKSTGELWVTTLKNDAKFEEELTCVLKSDMRNLTNFDSKLENLKICTLMSSLWAKYTIFALKNYRGVMCHETEGWCSI